MESIKFKNYTGQGIESFRTQIKQSSEIHHNLSKYYEQLKNKLSEALKAQNKFQDQIRKLSKNVASYPLKIAAIETQITEINNSITKLENELLQITTHIATIKTKRSIAKSL